MRGYGNFKKNWANSWKEEEGLSYSLRSGRRTTEWEDVSRFAARLRGKRASLGLTQGDVGAALGNMMTGGDFSQTTISRFEKLNLSLTNMLKLRPALEKWLQGGANTE